MGQAKPKPAAAAAMASKGRWRACDHHSSPNPLTVAPGTPDLCPPQLLESRGQGLLQPSGMTQLGSEQAVPGLGTLLPALPGAHTTGRACWAFTW